MIGSALVGTFLGILLSYAFAEPLAGLLELDHAIYGSGTWWDGVGLRLHESWAFYANGYLWPLSLWFWMALLTTAVLGLWAQRAGWLVEGDGPTRWLASPAGLRGLVLLFLTALGLWLLSADLSAEHDSTEAPTPEILLSGMLVDTHRVLMVLCYAGLILRWCAGSGAPALRRRLAQAGRMPLTLYLMPILPPFPVRFPVGPSWPGVLPMALSSTPLPVQEPPF